VDRLAAARHRATSGGQPAFRSGGSELRKDTLPTLVPAKPLRDDIVGGKGSVFYRAHSYHTKVPVEGLTRLIEYYTEPGETVVDPFCGSGQTGVAALLTGRRGVISDLSPAATHISRGYTARLNPVLFRSEVERILERLSGLERTLYHNDDGRIEYTVWTDVFRCPDCGLEVRYWDAAVDLEAASVAKEIACPAGHGPFRKTQLVWLRSEPVLENSSLDGSRTRLVREVKGDAAEPRVTRSEISQWFPQTPWDSWREMWRAQHAAQGIKTAADFFTDRNLAALAALWDAVSATDDERMREGLRFAFTATVNRASRRYQWHPSRPTNVLSSTMYLASLNYEFNVFSLFRRKVATIGQLYDATFEAPGSCEVHQGSATDLSWLASGEADYVFTDPPFGSNIYYGDSSFLWEAWLGEMTDLSAEAVVNKRLATERGRSTLDGYRDLMTASMCELARVLNPKRWASLQFHNSDDSVWSAIQTAVDDAGFSVGAAVVMDKGQASFKGLRHEHKGEKVANFDLVMHLFTSTQGGAGGRLTVTIEQVIDELVRYVAEQPPSRRTTPWLHSQVMRFLLDSGASVDGWSFQAVESLCAHLFEKGDPAWSIREQ